MRFWATRGPGWVVYADGLPKQDSILVYEIVFPGLVKSCRPVVRVDTPTARYVASVHGHRWTDKTRGSNPNTGWMLCTCGQWYGTRGAFGSLKIADIPLLRRRCPTVPSTLMLIRDGTASSPCHPAYEIEWGSLPLLHETQEIVTASCPHCETTLARVNPRTGRKEWLNGAPFYTSEDAR